MKSGFKRRLHRRGRIRRISCRACPSPVRTSIWNDSRISAGVLICDRFPCRYQCAFRIQPERRSLHPHVRRCVELASPDALFTRVLISARYARVLTSLRPAGNGLTWNTELMPIYASGSEPGCSRSRRLFQTVGVFLLPRPKNEGSNSEIWMACRLLRPSSMA